MTTITGTCDRHHLHGHMTDDGYFIHDDGRVCNGLTVKPDPGESERAVQARLDEIRRER